MGIKLQLYKFRDLLFNLVHIVNNKVLHTSKSVKRIDLMLSSLATKKEA